MKNERETLLKNAIADWHDGKLNDHTTMLIVSQLVCPQEPNEKAIQWAIDAIMKRELAT